MRSAWSFGDVGQSKQNRAPARCNLPAATPAANSTSASTGNRDGPDCASSPPISVRHASHRTPLPPRSRSPLTHSAGEALVVTDSKPTTSRLAFVTQSPTYQRMMENYYESDSPVVSALRSVTSTVGSWFDENETARVIRLMKELDPDFRLDKWQGELREYIVPEVVDAYLSADREGLRQWCGEAVSAPWHGQSGCMARDPSVC